MDDDKAVLAHHAQRDQARLAIIAAVIDAGEDRLLEDQRRIEQIDSARAYDFLPFVLVELKRHAAQSRPGGRRH